MALKAMESLAAYVALAFSFLPILGFPALLMFGVWIEKLTLLYTLKAGLYRVELGHGVVGVGLQALTGASKTGVLSGLHSKGSMEMQEFQEYVCGLPMIPGITANMCSIWQAVLYSSWAMMFAIGFGTCLMATGAVLLYQYAFVKARSLARRWALVFLCAGPALFAGGLVQYIFVALQVENMPPLMSGSTLGLAPMLAGTLCLFSFIPGLLMVLLIGETKEEQRNEAKHDMKQLIREQEMYGATGQPTDMQMHSYGAAGMLPPPPSQQAYGAPQGGPQDMYGASPQFYDTQAYGEAGMPPSSQQYAAPGGDPWGAGPSYDYAEAPPSAGGAVPVWGPPAAAPAGYGNEAFGLAPAQGGGAY